MSVRDYTTRQLVSPLERWEHDSTLKIHLAYAPPPSVNLDLTLILSQLRFTKLHIGALERAIEQIKPRRSYDLELELCNHYVMRQDLGCKLFPINSLPIELITKIFRFAIFQPPFATSEARTLSISWVCRHWRAVSLADRLLWGSLQFKDPPDWDRTLRFMERAGDARLDVRIIEDTMRPVDGQPYILHMDRMNDLMMLLVPKASQIRKMIVYVSDPISSLLPLHRLREFPLTSLERFDLRRTGLPTVFTPPESLPPRTRHPIHLGSGELPRMTFLILGGVALDWSRTTFRNLRQLELFQQKMSLCPTPQQWTQLLEACPTLYKIALDGSGPQWDWPSLQGVRKVRLPLLRELILGTMSLRFVEFVLTYLDAPGLMDLVLFELTAEDYGPLIQLLIGRFPEIVLLTIHNVEIFPNALNMRALVLWLESIPKLKMLKLSHARQIVFAAFLQDPRDYQDEQSGVDGPKKKPPQQESAEQEWAPDMQPLDLSSVVCPVLRVLEFVGSDQDLVVNLVGNRYMLGVRFYSVYTTQQWVSTITPASFKALTCYSSRFLTVEETGYERAPEEEIIHMEMALSSPGPSIYRRV